MNQLQTATIANTNTTRKYEISGNGDYVFTDNTEIINNRRTIKIAFVGLTTSSSDTVSLNCDVDELKIISFEISEENSILTIDVECDDVVSQTPEKLKLTDVYKGSINPNKPEPQPSIMQYQSWCGTCNRK